MTSRLLPVPAFIHQLTIKADLNGITILKEGAFRKRYTGSKKYSVDINGGLHTTVDLKRLIESEDVTNKKAAMKIAAGNPNNTMRIDSQDTKPTKTYKINKPEIRARIHTLVECQPEQSKELYFWTVTFPMRTSDDVIYRIFNIWLTRLRKEKMLRDYLWVAERQQNGTLHFHIAIPHKMSVKKAN